MRKFLLLLLYCLVVTPVGLIGRRVKDPMARRWERSAVTYWAPSVDR